jgi:hypothetical protein
MQLLALSRALRARLGTDWAIEPYDDSASDRRYKRPSAERRAVASPMTLPEAGVEMSLCLEFVEFLLVPLVGDHVLVSSISVLKL